MNVVNIGPKKILFIFFLIIVPLIVINMERKPEEGSGLLKPLSFFTGLIQNGYNSFSSGVRGTTAHYIDLLDIKKNNVFLNNQNEEYRAQLGALTELQLENVRLRKLLNFKEKTQMELLAARIIAKDLIPNHSTISINRGSSHGVKKYMAAITTGGVVGYVVRVELYSAHVLLLTDRYASIDSIVQRSRARGIVEGWGTDGSRLLYLQRNDDVQLNDLVVTSGLDNIFPKGFPVGTVSDVRKNTYGMSQDVDVKPIVNPFNLEEIFLVLNARQEDFSPKDQTLEGNDNKSLTDAPKSPSPEGQSQ